MKKMPCLFERTFHSNRAFALHETVTPGCEWALTDDGVPTVKWDGSACAVINGVLHVRYDAKRGKTPPPGAIPCDPEPDAVTGHWPHWVRPEAPQHKWHLAIVDVTKVDGTYEICGPHFSANPHGFDSDRLIRHGRDICDLPTPRSFSLIRDFLRDNHIEGIVFHSRATGAMCKIRRGDFGFPWPAVAS